MHCRLNSIESGSFFFQPAQLHLEPADLLVQLGDQGVLLLGIAAASVGEQLRRALQQPFFPLPDLRRMDAKGRDQLARRAVSPHRRQRHLRLHARLDPSSFRHVNLSILDQSYRKSDLKSWSSFPRPLYLLGLLNSRLAHCYFTKTCAGLEGKNETYLRFFGQYMENFPVRRLLLSDRADKVAHDRMVSLVDSMLVLHRQLAVAKSESRETIIQRQIGATDAEIDHLVYELYGLTAEEIAIVEEDKA